MISVSQTRSSLRPNSNGTVSIIDRGPYQIQVVSFYTPQYREVMDTHLLRSLNQRIGDPIVHTNYRIDAVPSRGSWVANCAIKPEYIRDRFGDSTSPMLWLDADAEIAVRGDLSPFDHLTAQYDVAVLRPDPDHRRRWPLVNSACLSGTILIRRDRQAVADMLDAWVAAQKSSPNDLDQDVLGRVLAEHERRGLKVGQLDPRFVCIPDLMPDVADPVIVHRQASRRMRDVAH